jgi:hypothetical protein
MTVLILNKGIKEEAILLDKGHIEREEGRTMVAALASRQRRVEGLEGRVV